MFCEKHYGEKCFGCGNESLPLASDPEKFACVTRSCPMFGRDVAKGNGGDTHGICDGCDDVNALNQEGVTA